LVSTARTTPLHMGLQASFQFPKAPPPRWLREQSRVEIGRREPTDPPNHDLFAFFLPFQRRARANPKLPPNGRGNRDLPLCGET
jgi:hypothetical protein